MLYCSNYTNKIINYIPLEKKIILNKNTKEILRIFFTQLKLAKQNISWEKHVIYQDNEINLKSSKYLPISIVLNIKKNLKFKYFFELNIKKHKIFVNFFVNKKDNKYYDYIKLIYIWLFSVIHYVNGNCGNFLYLNIYLNDSKKKLPSGKNSILDSNNINTGYTYGGCNSTNTITIYRKEEWFKVLIHECIHAFALDFSYINNDFINKKIKSLFPINSEINSFESYCEVWAIIWNSLIHALLNKDNNFDSFITIFREIYSYECYFSYYQMIKILNFMNITYSDLYKQDEKSILKRNNYQENTNVFSYFILKTILLQNLNDFISYTSKKNNILKFEISSKSLEDYYNIIKKNYTSFKFKLNSINDSTIKNSLRFSIFDID